MKTLFVPIDFSPSSLNALDFATSLALKLEAKLILFNAFQIPVPVADIPYEVMAEDIESKKDEVETKLIQECNKIQRSGKIPFGEIPLEYVAIEGAMPEAIHNYLSNEHVDYIVMGTNLAGHHTSGIFGSTASRVLATVECPVIIIPEHVHPSRELKKITFATDYQITDADAIAQLSVLAEAFRAQLNVLHVYKNSIPVDEQVSSMNYFMKAVSGKTSYNNITFQILEGKDAEEKLKDYIVSGEEADVVVMSTHIRNWIERVFGKSFTKQMALRAKVPMIIFHHKKEDMLSWE